MERRQRGRSLAEISVGKFDRRTVSHDGPDSWPVRAGSAARPSFPERSAPGRLARKPRLGGFACEEDGLRRPAAGCTLLSGWHDVLGAARCVAPFDRARTGLGRLPDRAAALRWHDPARARTSAAPRGTVSWLWLFRDPCSRSL